MEFFFQPTSRIHLPDLASLLEVRPLEVGTQNPLKRIDAWRRLWLPDPNRHTRNRLPQARAVSRALRSAQDHRRETHLQARSSRRLTRTGAQFQLQFAATCAPAHCLKQFACSPAIVREQDAILSGAHDEAVILFFTFVEMIIDVSATITDFDPNNILTITSRPQASRTLLPQRRFQFLGGK